MAALWPSLACVGCRGPCIGLRWLLWAFVGFVVIKKYKIKCKSKNRHTYHLWRHYGLLWPALAVVGLALAFVGRCGPALTCVGLRWPLLAAVGLRGLRSNIKN